MDLASWVGQGCAFSFWDLPITFPWDTPGSRWNVTLFFSFFGSKNSLLKDAMTPGTPKVGDLLHLFLLPTLTKVHPEMVPRGRGVGRELLPGSPAASGFEFQSEARAADV